jgi:hypothetical protein
MQKEITWAELEEAIKNMPASLKQNPVTLWGFESATTVDELHVCHEDYIHDGDEGCCTKSEFIEADPDSYDPDEHVVVFPKGSLILSVSNFYLQPIEKLGDIK